jgi:hypothetical protein
VHSQVVIITGPTAVGKTAVGLRVAELLGGEVISADSVQVYRGLDVGSDKVQPSMHCLQQPCHASFAAGASVMMCSGFLGTCMQRCKSLQVTVLLPRLCETTIAATRVTTSWGATPPAGRV